MWITHIDIWINREEYVENMADDELIYMHTSVCVQAISQSKYKP